MKKHRKKRHVKWRLRLHPYGVYVDDAYDLETVLARKPDRLQIDLAGWGEMPPDTALLFRTILRARAAGTHLVTNARSSLQNGAVLIWLLGDTRLIRPDAKLHLRATGPFAPKDAGEPASWDGATERDNEAIEEEDHLRVLEAINEFLPVQELAAQPIDAAALRQFGLIDNAGVDHFLAAAFRAEPPPEPPKLVKPRRRSKRGLPR